MSFGNCSSFLLFAMPVEFQLTRTQYSATNSGMHRISDAPFLSGSTFCSGLSYKLQLPQPPQIPVTPHISVKLLCSKLVQNLECQSGYGTQLFVCLLFAVTAMHCLLSNVLKCFFLIYILSTCVIIYSGRARQVPVAPLWQNFQVSH